MKYLAYESKFCPTFSDVRREVVLLMLRFLPVVIQRKFRQ